MFCVKVPVLSEQITLTAPSVSTADKSLIIAFSFAILLVPTACTIVTILPNASGIAATARAIAKVNALSTDLSTSSASKPRHKVKAKTTTLIPIMIIASI